LRIVCGLRIIFCMAQASNKQTRIREQDITGFSAYEVIEQRPLSEADIAARVVEDIVVRMGMSSSKESRSDHSIRIITIEKKPHRSVGHYGRRGTTGPACDGFLRLATNLLDVPAEIIALIYHYRSWPVALDAAPLRRTPVATSHVHFHSDLINSCIKPSDGAIAIPNCLSNHRAEQD
jgi:hypothetical protein